MVLNSEDWSHKENRATGDKAIYKAITGATKYAVREMFALASTDDPEKEEIRPSKSKPRTISQVQVNRLYKLATEEVGLSKERAKSQRGATLVVVTTQPKTSFLRITSA